MGRVGQFFTIGSVVIGSLLIGLILSVSSSFTDVAETATSSYFDSAAKSAPKALDDALSNNNSVPAVKERLYGHHRMVEVSAERRGIDYVAKHVVFMPRKEKVLYINYAPDISQLNLSFDSSFTVAQLQPRQSEIFEVGDADEFRVEFLTENISESINATQTRSISYTSMSTERNLFRRTTVN